MTCVTLFLNSITFPLSSLLQVYTCVAMYVNVYLKLNNLMQSPIGKIDLNGTEVKDLSEEFGNCPHYSKRAQMEACI